MSRALVEVEIAGKKLNAILDTEAWRSYIRTDLTKELTIVPVEPFEVKLCGRTFKVTEGRLVLGIIKDTKKRGYRFGNVLYPIGDLGAENNKRIDVLLEQLFLKTGERLLMKPLLRRKLTITILEKVI